MNKRLFSVMNPILAAENRKDEKKSVPERGWRDV